MNRRFLKRFIGEIRSLDEDRKLQLEGILQHVDRDALAVSNWVRILDIFIEGGLVSSFSFEREHILKQLEEGILTACRDENRVKILGIFLGLPLDIPTKVVLEGFSSRLISELRKERSIRLKAQLAHILVHCSPKPPTGARAEDYLWGIHHPEELARCQALLFLHKNYGEEILKPMWEAVLMTGEEPTLPLMGTLIGLVKSHRRGEMLSKFQELSLTQGKRVLHLMCLEERKRIPRFFLLPFILNGEGDEHGKIQAPLRNQKSRKPRTDKLKERLKAILKEGEKRGEYNVASDYGEDRV